MCILASASTGGASWWRVCYKRGLPRLVFKTLRIQAFPPRVNDSDGLKDAYTDGILDDGIQNPRTIIYALNRRSLSG